MRAALDSFRQGPGYEPGRYKVSNANRRPDVLGKVPPKSVRIRDLTLRVSEQISDVALSHEQRLDLLRALIRAGVWSLQVSSFSHGHTLEEMRKEVETAKTINPSCELNYAGAAHEEHMNRAVDAGYDSVAILSGTFLGRALPSYAGAVYHRAWQERPWSNLRFLRSATEVTERAQRLIEMGVQRGLNVSGSVLLLSYADDEYVAQYCKGIAEAGAFEVVLGDHASGTGPEAYAHFVRLIREVAPSLDVVIHSHGMFGLATACCTAGGLAGAAVLETTINGFAEGPMQGDLAHVVAAMEMLYGVPTGVDTTQLTPLSRLAESLFKMPRPPEWGITGRHIFDFGNDGDEYAQELKVDRLIHMSVVPDAVGNVAHRRIGLISGPWTMWDKLDELGIHVEKAEVEPILAACKAEMAHRNHGLEDSEIRTITLRTRKALRG
jgi:isopropylmalate/homocitrate/citramalate synthase